MNKKIWVLVVAMGIFLGTWAFGEDDMSEKMGGGQGKGNKMMGMMHQESMIATSDGGVVILLGPRLVKYDKDLNLVKEVEMPRGKKPGYREMKNDQTGA